MGPKLLKYCEPEQLGTQEFDKMMNRIQTLEGRVPAKEAKNWSVEGEKKIITRKEYKRLVNNFEMEGLMAQKGLWNLAKEKIMKEGGELPDEESDAAENFWSSWLREDERGKEERMAKAEKKEEEKGEKRKRRKKRMKRRRSEEDVRVVFLWRLLKSLVKGETWRVMVARRGEIPWRSLMTCLCVSLFLARWCVGCLM